MKILFRRVKTKDRKILEIGSLEHLFAMIKQEGHSLILEHDVPTPDGVTHVVTWLDGYLY